MIRVRLLVAVVVLLVTGSTVRAQPPTCEDAARVSRELVARYVAERARGEVETAGEIARLKKAMEHLINERDAARAKLQEKGK